MSTGTADLVETLLQVVLRHPVTAPDAEAGVAVLSGIASGTATPEEWHNAVAEAVRAGYLHDPVRLPPGALQCHWHLQLTPGGVAAARARSR